MNRSTSIPLDDMGIGGWGNCWLFCPICSFQSIAIVPFGLDGEPQPSRLECGGCSFMVDVNDVDWIPRDDTGI